jgi:hypothetical protein
MATLSKISICQSPDQNPTQTTYRVPEINIAGKESEYLQSQWRYMQAV